MTDCVCVRFRAGVRPWVSLPVSGGAGHCRGSPTDGAGAALAAAGRPAVGRAVPRRLRARVDGRAAGRGRSREGRLVSGRCHDAAVLTESWPAAGAGAHRQVRSAPL